MLQEPVRALGSEGHWARQSWAGLLHTHRGHTLSCPVTLDHAWSHLVMSGHTFSFTVTLYHAWSLLIMPGHTWLILLGHTSPPPAQVVELNAYIV